MWKLLRLKCVHVVLFIMLCKVVPTFKSVDETLVCDHSNESYWAVLSCGTVYYAAQSGSCSNFQDCRWNPCANMVFSAQHFHMVLFIMLYKLVLTFKSVDETLVCDHSNESYWAVLSCGTVYYAVQGGSNFWVYGWNPSVWPFKWKLLSSTFMWYCLLCCTRWL